MDAWFALATGVFGAFLEEKFDLYGSLVAEVQIRATFAAMRGGSGAAQAVAASSAVTDAALITDVHLRGRPAEFLDNIESAVFDAMEGLPTGFGLETDNETEAAATLYGELTGVGIRQVVAFLAEQAAAAAASTARRRFVFWDLGSGTGRVTMESLLLLRAEFPQGSEVSVDAVGVEYCHQRHEVALRALDRLIAQKSSAVLAGNIGTLPPLLTEGDFFQTNIPLVDEPGNTGDAEQKSPGVLAFCCGVGFGVEQTREICSRLAALEDRLVAAVLLFKSPPTDHSLLANAGAYLAASGHVSATWMESAPATFVSRNRQ
jgi:hypothetical protein